MADSPVTRATLLLRLRDRRDPAAWREFVDQYGPMLYRFVSSRGLQDADAAAVVQEVFRRVGSAIGRLEYDRRRGGFRDWLFKVTRNCLADFSQQRQSPDADDHDDRDWQRLQFDLGDDLELERRWDFEHQRKRLLEAMQNVRPRVEPQAWEAFRATTLEGHPVPVAAKRLGMTAGAVYVARSRTTAQLRQEALRLLEVENEDWSEKAR